MEERKEKEKKLSREELIREAEKINREVENDDSLKDIPFPEDLDRKVMERIRLYEESREKETESQTDNLVHIKKKRPGVFILVAVITVLVLAFGMNSVGSVPFFTEKKKYDVGDREMDKLNTNRETNKEYEKSLGTEAKAFQEIEDTFGVIPVSFGYTSQNMSFKKHHINKDINGANFIYNIGEDILEYQMMFDYTETVRGYDIDEESQSEEERTISDVAIQIIESKLEDGSYQHKAQFTYENVHYVLNAVMDEEEFDQIIENLIFP